MEDADEQNPSAGSDAPFAESPFQATPYREPDRAALERLAEATRGVIDQVRRSAAPPELMDEATATLEQLRARLAPYAWPGPYAQSCLRIEDPMVFEGTQPGQLFPYSPIVGARNPIAPPVALEERDGAIHGKVSFAAAYTGPPGFVHGGIIALVFDELLGVASVVAEEGAFTGTLEVRYRAPTPIETPIELEGRVTGREGRKIFAHAELRSAGVVTAEAQGIFVCVKDRD